MTPIDRRAFLKTVAQAGLFCAAPSFARAAAALNPDTITISILHTTDLHGHILPTADYNGNTDLGGLARCITQIRQWRAQNPDSILIDVGDVYQGTEVALRSKGRLIIDLFNHHKFDAWVVGNHEFDWGVDPFFDALKRSKMPIVTANISLEGRPPGHFPDAKHPFARVQPCLLKEFAGIKVAIIGVTTPGMPFWFRPEFTRALDFQYPLEPVRRAISKAKGDGAHAIVLAGHMGLKPRTGGDDFANTVMALISEFPEVAVFIAGHTHQLVSSRFVNNVLLTQADHFGIHAGRVDLVFDRESKRLLHREARCELMDNRFQLDPTTISRAKSQLASSAAALSQPIGELAETMRVRGQPGQPSDVERLIGAAIAESLHEHGTPVAGAMHGVFDDRNNFIAGPKTVNDIWNIIPFENYLVTAELTHEEIIMIMEEVFASHENRSLLGFDIVSERRGTERRITSMTLSDGRPLERGKRYLIAFNSFDSRSAGRRFMKLRDLLETPATNCTLRPIQTRDALIDYFRRHKVVRKIVAPGELPAAA